MSGGSALQALVLAGSRAGGDPLARAAGVSHKALLEVGGQTMIERVVGALSCVPAIERIVVAIEDPAALHALPGLQSQAGIKPLTFMAAQAGPSASVAAALAHGSAPFVVTTADHALLQGAWVEEFLRGAPGDADVVAVLARRESVQAVAPQSKRTWLRFADGAYGGCNLFLLRPPAASRAVAFWQTLERDRKNPLAMMRRLGLSFALRYRLGLLDLAAATARLGELAGAKVAIVVLRDGRAAIDVDSSEDLALVRTLAAPVSARCDEASRRDATGPRPSPGAP